MARPIPGRVKVEKTRRLFTAAIASATWRGLLIKTKRAQRERSERVAKYEKEKTWDSRRKLIARPKDVRVPTTPTPFLAEVRYSMESLSDTSDGLSYYQARYYDAALNRFIQPDTIIPNIYDPQYLNRYSYGLNNPVKYIDPTGHDLMIVGGFGNDDWEDPSAWKDRIMAYKGWKTDEEWKSGFADLWAGAKTDAAKQAVMAKTGIHIFNWNTCDCATPGVPKYDTNSGAATTAWAIGELYKQMQGMKDITLLAANRQR